MMAGAHCAQCSDTRNIYIKTCDCSKQRVVNNSSNNNKTISAAAAAVDNTNKPLNEKLPVVSVISHNNNKEFPIKTSAVDQKTDKHQQTEDTGIKAVKAVLYRVVRVYETVPSKTMKFVGAITLLLLLVAVCSIALAQNKEETKSQYGMAFPLEDSQPLGSTEQRISIIGSVPGEGVPSSTVDSTSESPVTTTLTPTTEESVITTTTTSDDSERGGINSDSDSQTNDSPALIIANANAADDDEDKIGDNGAVGDEKQNPRLVFIERLMGLHLSAPFNKDREEEKDDNSAVNDNNEAQLPFSSGGGDSDDSRNPFDKVNAKWATRMRKFSIPLQMQQQLTPPETPNPLLRMAAAAMMTRLLAAAARAHHNGPMMAKDKDDDAEDETMPLLLASMRSDDSREPPMYGRPMPRPPMMRQPMRPPIRIIAQPQQQRMASIAIPQRSYAAPMLPQRAQIAHRPLPPVQPVLVMLAHVPMPMQMAESRMSHHSQPDHHYYGSQQQPQSSMPMYQQMPYALPVGYHSLQRQVIPVEIPTPVHMPVPVASYQRPVYQSPYQSSAANGGPTIQYQRQSMRPVIEIPIEIPVPYHVPMPVQYQSAGGVQQQSNHIDSDHDTSPSEAAEQVAIVYYDPDGNDGPNDDNNDQLEPQTSESHDNMYAMSPVGQGKGFHFMSKPLPDIQSATKLKLWREYVGAKHAAQPGVRYIPVAINSGPAAADSEPMHQQVVISSDQIDSQSNGESSAGETSAAESQSQPAFVILADDSANGADNTAELPLNH